MSCTKSGTCCSDTISKDFCDVSEESFNFQLQEKYFSQIVKLFWRTSATNQVFVKNRVEII